MTILKYIFLVGILILISCKKNPFDYRNIYVGDYDFTIYVSEVNWISQTVIDDTLRYDGKVTYGSTKDYLKIYYLDNMDIELYIRRNGDLYNVEIPDKVGTISKDTLKWGYTSFVNNTSDVRRFINIIGVKND